LYSILQNIEFVLVIIEEDSQCAYEDIEEETVLSHETVFRNIYDQLTTKSDLIMDTP